MFVLVRFLFEDVGSRSQVSLSKGNFKEGGKHSKEIVFITSHPLRIKLRRLSARLLIHLATAMMMIKPENFIRHEKKTWITSLTFRLFLFLAPGVKLEDDDEEESPIFPPYPAHLRSRL